MNADKFYVENKIDLETYIEMYETFGTSSILSNTNSSIHFGSYLMGFVKTSIIRNFKYDDLI